MAEISIGDAVGSGFGLIRSRPLAVFVWGGVKTAFLAGFFALMAPMYVAMFTQIAHQAASGAAAAPNPAALAGMMQYQSLSLLLQVVGLFVNAVLYCAVFRAVIHPDQNRFACMRLGAAELFVFVLMIGEFIVFFIAALFVGLIAGLVIGLLSVLHAGAIAALLGVILGVLGVWGVVYTALRLGMIGPMIVDDGKFHLLDAWALTKGRAGGLFLIGFCVSAILIAVLIVLEIVLVAAFMGVGLHALGGGGSEATAALFKQNPTAVLSKFIPLVVCALVIAIPVYGAVLAIMGAPWARAYLDLRQMPATDVATVFG